MTVPPPVTVLPVILAGGGGTRLWPLSRSGHPKQFLALAGGQASLFQQTVRRLGALTPDAPQAPLVVTHEEHRFLVLDQLARLGVAPGAVLLEPAARNTAPALTLAALAATEDGGDPVLVVSPADHFVTDEAAFTQALSRAVDAAATGALVVLGITPTRAETGYGWIRSAPADGLPRVARFVEKPDAATAARLLAQGDHLWNSGLFVLRASTWLAALAAFAPDILAAVRQAWAGRQPDHQFTRPETQAFAGVRADSVDYAVMERCPASAFDTRVVPLDAGWTDLGAWDAVWQLHARDAQGNATEGDVALHDAHDCLVHASARLVAVVGLRDVVVVETSDAVLVMDRAASQQVKAVAEDLARRGRPEASAPRKVHRPWGWYDGIDGGERFQVKRIMVKPGASLSLQRHAHRAEHWVVVRGTAQVTCGERSFLVGENESTFIPRGHPHRLANPGEQPLEIVEVQSGDYLGEDDIERLDDAYGRR